MKVFIERENRSVEIEARSIKEMLAKLKINPNTVLIARGDTLITEDTEVSNNDELRLLSVVSGG